jgi:hypothetical protein
VGGILTIVVYGFIIIGSQEERNRKRAQEEPTDYALERIRDYITEADGNLLKAHKIVSSLRRLNYGRDVNRGIRTNNEDVQGTTASKGRTTETK